MKILLLSIFLICTFRISAQKNYLERDKQYGHSRIYSNNQGVLKVNNFKLENDSIISFKIHSSNVIKTMNISNFNFAMIKSGTNALRFGLYGAALGSLSILGAINKANTDPYYKNADNKNKLPPVFLGITMGCGITGAIIGALTPKWQRLNKSNVHTSCTYSVIPNSNVCFSGIQLLVKF